MLTDLWTLELLLFWSWLKDFSLGRYFYDSLFFWLLLSKILYFASSLALTARLRLPMTLKNLLVDGLDDPLDSSWISFIYLLSALFDQLGLRSGMLCFLLGLLRYYLTSSWMTFVGIGSSCEFLPTLENTLLWLSLNDDLLIGDSALFFRTN